MAEAEGIPPTASVASVGPNLRYLGQHCYAYSGSITPAGGSGADTVVLEFSSGSGYIVAQVQVACAAVGNEDRYTDIIFNGLTVVQLKADGAPDFYDLFPVNIIIPPFTEVIIKVGEVEGPHPFNVQLIGRVYDA